MNPSSTSAAGASLADMAIAEAAAAPANCLANDFQLGEGLLRWKAQRIRRREFDAPYEDGIILDERLGAIPSSLKLDVSMAIVTFAINSLHTHYLTEKGHPR